MMARYVKAEGDYSPGLGHRGRFLAVYGSVDPSSVGELYRFRPPTTYLAVNYMDRFLSRHSLPQSGGWPVQLTSVACLSLAAKMEESLIPSLLDLQVEEGRFVFEPRTVQRMELLVLDALNWRLRYVTPFDFVGFFAWRADPTRAHTRSLVSRATHLILETLQEIDFLGHCPSATSAAAIICAASEGASLPPITPNRLRYGHQDCYQLMRRLVVDGGWEKRRRNSPPPKIETSLSMDSDGPPPSTSSPSNKRRKLSDCRWVDDSEERERERETHE
ncbi:unnamed protein product [Spirodela intermedia]|uniref:Cyclin-like domain-containing protein n=1 Tax=Spirodela intermedia TaxID=51605 RepID=A0A7I8JKE6_SPIIN|nr:unnamed protein product [Spirodela intermedia]CAA6670618.1 unnamed protein product [Spirodela intermedia]